MTQRLDHRILAADGMRTFGSVHQYVMKSGLPRTLIDLVFLRVSQINGCAYCIAMHAHDLRKADVAVDKLMLLSAWREVDGLYSDQERAALQWAESVTLIGETGAPEADYRVAAEAFDGKALVDLTIAIALINAYNRLAISFRTIPEGVAGR